MGKESEAVRKEKEQREGKGEMKEKDNNRSVKQRHLLEISEEIWNGINKIRKKYNITWQELFERFYNYQDWLNLLLQLPKKPSKGDFINVVTVHSYMALWLESIYQNFLKPHIKNLPSATVLQDIGKGRPGLVIGAGPSLTEYKYLELLSESSLYREKKGIIISASHALKTCLDAGVIPDYITLIDPTPKMRAQIDYDIVDKYASEITGIFPITIHPDVLQRWNGNKVFFLSSIPEMTIPNVQAVLSGLFPNIAEMNGCANAGTFSCYIAAYMKCNPIAMIGMDMSFMPGTPIKETPYYDALRHAYETEEEMIEKSYHFHTHSFFHNDCYTDDMYYQFMKGTVTLAKYVKEHEGINFINCTGRGMIDEPEIIENMWFEDFLKRFTKREGGGEKGNSYPPGRARSPCHD